MATILDNAVQKALTTLSRAKSFLGIAGDSKDTQLIIIINQATGAIESFCKRHFKRQVYTDEIYDGSGVDTIVLKNFPVTAVAKLEVNAGTVGSPSWQTIESSRYSFYEDGRVTLGRGGQAFLDVDAGCFIDAPKKYRVTYTAGYLIDFSQENTPAAHNLPQDLEYACLKLVSGVLNSGKAEGLSAARVGDVSMTYKGEIFKDPELKAILAPHEATTI